MSSVIDRVRNGHDHAEELLTPSMKIIASKSSRSLINLFISSKPIAIDNGITHRNSRLLTSLSGLHEIRKFSLLGWTMENIDDAVRRLAKSWPKLRTFTLGLLRYLDQTFVSISTLRLIADNCPELEILDIPLDISTIPPFDDISIKNLPHNLEVLSLGSLGGVPPPDQTILKCQIQVARCLDLIFPYLEIISGYDEYLSEISDLVKLCQDVRRNQ